MKNDFDLICISEKKTLKMFDKVELVLGKGEASFIDSHTVRVGDKTITAQRIFIATGTEPLIPPINSISDIDILTNQNIFKISKIPESMRKHDDNWWRRHRLRIGTGIHPTWYEMHYCTDG